MKRLTKVIIVLTMLVGLGSLNIQAAKNKSVLLSEVNENTVVEDFFIGKWKLEVYGLPTGDATMLMVIEKKDGKLEGTLGGENGENPNQFTKVEIDKETLLVRFMGGGYDVPMYLDKDGDNAVLGSMNDMFDVEGKKIIEKK